MVSISRSPDDFNHSERKGEIFDMSLFESEINKNRVCVNSINVSGKEEENSFDFQRTKGLPPRFTKSVVASGESPTLQCRPHPGTTLELQDRQAGLYTS
ncbi:hypothetical protein TNCV_2299021 [Trichonephila clavipes]|nr:hypothetical protein TNCV_2299021 [Trichonephila clavipes]